MSKASYRAGRDGSYRYFSSFSLFSAFSVSSEHGKAIFTATGHCKAKKGRVAKPRWVGWPWSLFPGGIFLWLFPMLADRDQTCPPAAVSGPSPSLLAGAGALLHHGRKKNPWKEPSDIGDTDT